jgi:hypothetical protein
LVLCEVQEFQLQVGQEKSLGEPGGLRGPRGLEGQVSRWSRNSRKSRRRKLLIIITEIPVNIKKNNLNIKF